MRLLFFIVALVASVAHAETRELGRIIVIDLETKQTFDSHWMADRPNVQIAGTLTTTGSPITRIEFDALLTFVGDGEPTIYQISDDADTVSNSQRGAKYTFWSRLGLEQYFDVTFLRRAPSFIGFEIEGVAHTLPNYDAATIMEIERDGVIYQLDYRAASGQE